MSDTASNKFIGYGTEAERAAFTPSPATIAAAPYQLYLWYATDSDLLWVYTSAWQIAGGGGGQLLTTDPATPANDTWWVYRDGASPQTVSLKVRIGGVTYVLASITI